MAWFWISYTICDSESNRAEGSGTIEWELGALPANADEVAMIGKQITELSHNRGVLPVSQRVQVSGWSEMGPR